MVEMVNTVETVDLRADRGGERPPSLADRAFRAIRDRLVMLDIAPGAPINEERLGTELAVGRTPMREALKRLEHERLVVIHPRRGTFAAEVNITDLAHVSEVRHELEPMAAARAARRASRNDRATLGRLAAEVGTAADRAVTPDDLMRMDLRIHRAIYAATHNPYLEDTLIRYDNLATRIWCLFLDRLPGMAGHVQEHGPLVQGVIAGDEETSARLASAHVTHFEREIRALL